MKTGDKVVCIKTPKVFNGEAHPIAGEIYTVRDVTTVDGPRILLVEIINYPRNYYEQGFTETGFKMERFRPVDDTFGEVVAEIIEKQIEVEEMGTV